MPQDAASATATTASATVVTNLKRYFASGQTLPLSFRTAQLQALRSAVKSHEPQLLAALKADLRKPEFEAYSSEIGFLYREIDHALAHLADWMAVQNFAAAPGGDPSEIHQLPKGVVLIIGPWNYPVNLVLSPLIGAIAAGNCAVVKPSEVAPHTMRAVGAMLAATFPADYCTVVYGGVDATAELLRQPFDHIFFTGSIAVGKIVMRAAAENLVPVTLELGGKSPCLIDTGVDLAVTAKRLVWGKFYNAGQICVAPDYLLVPRALKEDLVAAMKREITAHFGPDAKASPDFARIINHQHFDRLSAMLTGNIVHGGATDRHDLYIEPTIIDDATMALPAMREEIFGPIFPVLTYDTLEEATALIAERPNPLALYLFTNSKATEAMVMQRVPFGGGCINNVILHLTNPNVPFGGIGASGMGAYHGVDSFAVFTHRKGLVRSGFHADATFRYPPYGQKIADLRKILF